MTKNTIQLETGENREGTTMSCRLFFVYVTPTGMEMPLSKCPLLYKCFSNSHGGFDGSSRLVTAEYEVKGETTLKMVNIVSQYGSPRRVVNLVLHLSPDDAAVSISGLNKFGKFQGRCKVDYDESTYREPHKIRKLDMQVLKDEFAFSLIQPPKKVGGSGARSLIFD